MRKSLKTKMISLLLCIVMLSSFLPISVMGQTEDSSETELITIQMFDSYGDGWNGAAIDVYENGILIGEATLENFYDAVCTFVYDSSKEYEFFWATGEYDNECSFRIFYGDKLVYVADGDRCNSYLDNYCFYPVCTSHEFSIVEVIEPSCDKDGFTRYTCEICGWFYTSDYVKSTIEHTKIEDTTVVVEPTCTEDGYTMYECSVCEEIIYDDYVESLGGHTKNLDTAVVTEPTCTEDGYTMYECSVCEEIFYDDYVSGEHNFVQALITAPTCVLNGYTTYKCEVCDLYKNDDYIDALGHTRNLDTAVVTEPTCIEEGYTTYECSICKELFEDDYVAPLGHTKDLDTAVVTEPTCIEKGYTTYECGLCKELIYDEYKNMLGHTLGENGNCTVCGDLYTIPVWIGGNQIEASNMNDVLGDGTVSYDTDSNTLTIENVDYYSSNTFLYSEIPLNIIFKGTNYLDSESSNLSFDIVEGDINIGGDGSVKIYYYDMPGITIDGVDVSLNIGDNVQLLIEKGYDSTEYQQEGIYIEANNVDVVIKDDAEVKLGSASNPLDEEGFYLIAEEKSNIIIKDNANLKIFTIDEEGIYLGGNEQYVTIEGSALVKIESEEECIDAANVNISGGFLYLEADVDYEAIYADNVIINGGSIFAIGDFAGINVNESLVINGGNIIAKGTSIEMRSYGIIVDGTFEMNGGSLTAAGNEDGIYIFGEAVINSGTIKVDKGGIWVEVFDEEQEIDVPGLITVGPHFKVTNPEGGSICGEYVDDDGNTYSCIIDAEGKETYSFILTDNNIGKEHSFTNYISNNDATCEEDGTKTAHCDYGCGETDTIVDEGSKIKKIEPIDEADIEIKENSNGDRLVTDIPVGKTANEVVNMFNNSENIQLYHKDGRLASNDDLVGSGAYLQLTVNGEAVDTVMIMIIGDVNGDAKVNNIDATLIRRSLVDFELGDFYEAAADVNGSSSPDNLDATLIRRYLVGMTDAL